MEKNYFDLTLEEFLNYFVHNSNFVNDIDKYKYFEKITNNFENRLVQLVLADIQSYKQLDIAITKSEEDVKAYRLFIQNNSIIPNKKNPNYPFDPLEYVCDYDQIKKDLHFNSVIDILQYQYNELEEFLSNASNKVNEPDEPETQYPEKYSENKYPLIFTNEGYNFYQYLIDNYFIDDFKSQAKHSLVYEFMKYEDMIICASDQEYQSFLNDVYEIKIKRLTKGKPNYSFVEKQLKNLLIGFRLK